MKKNLLFLSITLFTAIASAQVPYLTGYSFTTGVGSLSVCINYTANDNQDIHLQVQLGKDFGEIYYDYNFTASHDSTEWCTTLTPLVPCDHFRFLINLTNSHGTGQVYDPLFEFTTGCASGIYDETAQSISVIQINGNSLQIIAEAEPLKNSVIEVFDVTGKKLLSEKWTSSTQNISCNQFVEGIYFVRIAAENKLVYSDRFLIH